jgi:hypothetical protein
MIAELPKPELKVEVAFTPPDDWEPLLEKAGFTAGFEQSIDWSRILIELDHVDTKFIKIIDKKNNSPIIGLLAVVQKPIDRESGKIGIRSYISGQSRGSLVFAEGPFHLTSDRNLLIDAYAMLWDWMEEFCHQNRLFSIKTTGNNPLNPLCDDAELKKNLIERGFSVTHWATYIVDLNQNRDFLFNNLDKAAKKQLRKAEDQGLTVQEISDKTSYWEKFVIPYKEFEIAAGRIPPIDKSFEAMWRLGAIKYYRFFCVMDRFHQVIGLLGIFGFNNIVTEITSAVSQRVYTEHLAAQDLLHWEIICRCKDYGFSYFNLAGVNPDPQTPKEAGIRQFKAKWGGKYITYMRYSKQYPTLIQKLYHLIRTSK